jgi:predicted nucleotidyltransferase
MLQHPLYVTTVGSKLYNIDTESSDRDFKGFGHETLDCILGLKNFEQQDYDNHLEGAAQVQGVLYSTRRFFHILMKSNPTVLEVVFADKKYVVHSTPLGEEICSFVRKNMVTKAYFKSYSAYHMAQMRKMQTINPIGKRKELVDKYSYDVKFAAHAIRLAKQCSEVMMTGELNPTLSGNIRDTIIAIRNGLVSKEDALKLMEESDKEMYVAYGKSKLADNIDFDFVNEYLVGIYREYVRNARHYNKTDSIDVLGLFK